MRAKPTLGYPSRSAAVAAMRREGLTRQAIAHRIGIKESTVAALEHSARRGQSQQIKEADARTIVFPVDLLDELAPHAARRGIHVNALVRRLIECIVDDNLVTAVMGDADFLEVEGRKGEARLLATTASPGRPEE